MSDFFASAHMAGGKLWGQPALLHSTDGIRRDLVLFRYTGKPFPGAFQCARTQNLGQLIGGLIEIGEAKVLAYTLERVCRTECFLCVSFLQRLLQLWIAVVVQKHQRKFTDHTLTGQPMKYLFIVCAHFFITLLNRHNPLHGLSYFFLCAALHRHKNATRICCSLLCYQYTIYLVGFQFICSGIL